MIKDHRTKHEVGNIKSVMDGNIDDFIYSYLLDKMEKINKFSKWKIKV